MKEPKVKDITGDSGRSAIPPGNLASLKEYLATKRAGKDKTPTDPLKEARRQIGRQLNLPQTVKVEFECFLVEVGGTAFLQPDGRPGRSWRVHTGATWAEALQQARESARGVSSLLSTAGRSAMLLSAKSEVDALGRGEAWLIAWNKVSDIVSARLSKAPQEVARDAAWSAGLMAACTVVQDLQFTRHLDVESYAQDVWEVWKKGYAILLDFETFDYVFCSTQKI